ncbi:MAG: LLM class flavin-dependent oxidoreductase [Sphingomonas sp.]
MSFRDRRPLILSLFYGAPGHHVAAWRHPDAPAAGANGFALAKQMALEAERNFYDLFFLADILYVHDRSSGRRALGGQTEPITLLSALAAVTDRIGLAGTISTTYSQPFTVARALAALDHLSGGRAAWNAVTSLNHHEARNFGVDRHPDHDRRYERARDYVDVVRKYWDSWEDEAIIGDKAAGAAFDPARIHAIDHHSEFYDVAGPGISARPPQGHPVIIQAGSSDAGQDLAAATADAVFTAQNDLAGAQDFYRKLKARVAAYGRDPDTVAILPGMLPIVGRTEAEAQAKFQQLQDLIDPAIGLAMLSQILGEVDLGGVDLDKPLPRLDVKTGSLSRLALVTGIGEDNSLTVRELYTRIAGGRGHFTVVGSDEQVAERLVEWFVGEGADGFNVMPAVAPGSFGEFNAHVLPILRERGFARDRYEGRTLREHLGLERPANVHLAEPVRTVA